MHMYQNLIFLKRISETSYAAHYIMVGLIQLNRKCGLFPMQHIVFLMISIENFEENEQETCKTKRRKILYFIT